MWSVWSQCSSECDSGVQTRERFCNSPSPQHEGSSCPGPHIQTRDCNSHPCLGTVSCFLIIQDPQGHGQICAKLFFKSCTPFDKCVHVQYTVLIFTALLSSQTRVQRAWCTWQQQSVRLTAVLVHGCVWTWPPQRCSVLLPVTTAATAPWAFTCSTAAVCPWHSAHVTTKGSCTQRVAPCLSMLAITGTVSKDYSVYNLPESLN